MPESYSASRTVSKIAEKVVEILDIFDLSFFISGAVATAALLVYFKPEVEALVAKHTGISVFGLVVASYVLGLVCFAVGRPLRLRVQGWWERYRAARRRDPIRRRTSQDVLLRQALLDHGLVPEDGPVDTRPTSFATLFGYRPPTAGDEPVPSSGLSALYTRLWAHVRSYEELQESFALLKRYWVLSASYDGMAIAVLMWLLPIGASTEASAASVAGSALWIVLIVGSLVACWHRAREYKRYQVEELVATIAHWMSMVGRGVLRDLEAGPASERAAPSTSGVDPVV